MGKTSLIRALHGEDVIEGKEAMTQGVAIKDAIHERKVADQLRSKLPKLAALMDEAEQDVLAYMTFPAQQRPKLHSTNPIERLNGEIKRRTAVVGIFPNEAAITRLRGDPPRTERRMGRAAQALHHDGKHRAFER